MTDIVVVDYGLGNLFSVRRALESVGASVTVTSDPHCVLAARRLILPGVGAFGDGMAGLAQRGLIQAIQTYAASRRPILAICLGMQLLMTEGTEFGVRDGLALVPGRVITFADKAARLKDKVPHVGWCELNRSGNGWAGSVLRDVKDGDYVYFTHSYFPEPALDGTTIATARHAGVDFCAALQHGNLHGCQFHPEKSGEVGQRIFRRFLEIA